MRLAQLEITNFKALTYFAIEEVGDAVVLAGANGSGKSCVLDAIRLLKSAYAGYNQNEWHNWFGEFQINFQQRPQELARLLQDPARDLRISGKFAFAEPELTYIRENALTMLREAAWRELVPELASWRSILTTSFASQYRAFNPEVERRAEEGLSEVTSELDAGSFSASIVINSSGVGKTEYSRVLELAFASYDPSTIGVMEFFSANRQYNRENVGGINLDVTGVQEQRRQSALYNMQNKYAGLKSEMASVYVRQLLAKEAGSTSSEEDSLILSLQDLFATFFPDKTFAGPRPTSAGLVEFPVTLRDGSTHDLDELSSGEKEVLYGYMRLRNSAPANSVILVDEPELHLNPRLIQGLARFYYNHLVVNSGNQLWLISHSDTLLREAVNLKGFDVFHMRLGDRSRPDENQAKVVLPGDEIEHLVIELVGDLAAYRPGAKVVLFEGGGDVEFDVRMVSRLFPEFDGAVNSIAAGGKRRVSALHDVLERVGRQTMGARFYAVKDRDSDLASHADDGARMYSWDVYHIENYLLEPEYVYTALSELSGSDQSLRTTADVDRALKDCAAETIGHLVRHRIVTEVNSALTGALGVGGDPKSSEVAPSVAASVQGAGERVARLVAGELSEGALAKREREIRADFAIHLETEAWRKSFRGRDVLARFANHHTNVSYEAFRDSVLARMKDAGHRPAGMAAVLEEILGDPFPET
ncbi:MAG: AAA family ATPase [Gaiellaceae bacterium]